MSIGTSRFGFTAWKNRNAAHLALAVLIWLYARAIELFLQVAAAVQMDKLLLHLIIQKNGDGREELYRAMIDRLQCRNVPGGPCRPAADRCVAACVMRWPRAPGERERERGEARPASSMSVALPGGGLARRLIDTGHVCLTPMGAARAKPTPPPPPVRVPPRARSDPAWRMQRERDVQQPTHKAVQSRRAVPTSLRLAFLKHEHARTRQCTTDGSQAASEPRRWRGAA